MYQAGWEFGELHQPSPSDIKKSYLLTELANLNLERDTADLTKSIIELDGVDELDALWMVNQRLMKSYFKVYGDMYQEMGNDLEESIILSRSEDEHVNHVLDRYQARMEKGFGLVMGESFQYLPEDVKKNMGIYDPESIAVKAQEISLETPDL